MGKSTVSVYRERIEGYKPLPSILQDTTSPKKLRTIAELA